MTSRLERSPNLADLRTSCEAFAVIALTWLLLGWPIDRAISQADGSVTWIPYTQSALDAGFDWTRHLYRFAVLGGSQMHDSGGTSPICQLAGLLGLSPTATANVTTLGLQLCFAFFGIKTIEALATAWSAAPRRLSAPERIAAVWSCGFAPVLAWRLAYGHDNLVMGLVPWIAAVSLWWAARAGTLTITQIVAGTLAVFVGTSGLGAQLIVYSAVFGAPFAIASAWGAWRRAYLPALLALAAGVLLVVPRLAGMIDHQLGDDASRGLAGSLTYSYGSSEIRDWLTSIPWSTTPALRWPGVIPIHETNVPIGPLACVVVAAWPGSRRVTYALLAGALLAIVFALGVVPIDLPVLESFRVPARAMIPIAILVPSVGLAALWSSDAASVRPRIAWLAIAIGAAMIWGARVVPSVAREPAAWIGCVALAGLVRWRPAWVKRFALAAAVPAIAALGVAAFDERLLRDVPFDRIEHGPRRLHDAVIAQAPELAMPLDRIAVIDPAPPFEMSTAFAAELGSLDGAWFPPRRFLALYGALLGRELPATSGVFELTRSRAFPILQQLYNVMYVVSEQRGSMQALPPTPGAAWFPAHVTTVDDAPAVARALAAHAGDLRETLRTTAWLVRGDPLDRYPDDPACNTARVTDVATDALGQTATIAVETAHDCPLVIATNYVTALHATATIRGETRAAAVFPIDVALTGVVVPAGTSTIVLAPQPFVPWWTRVAQLIGLGMLVLAVLSARARA